MTSQYLPVSGGSSESTPQSVYCGVPRPTVRSSVPAVSCYLNVGDGGSGAPQSTYLAAPGAYSSSPAPGGAPAASSNPNFSNDAASAYFGVGGGSSTPASSSGASSTMTAVGAPPGAAGGRASLEEIIQRVETLLTWLKSQR